MSDPRRLVLLAATAARSRRLLRCWGGRRSGTTSRRGCAAAADASGDGHVSAKELAAYVRARVDRWSRAARRVRQTPVLLGQGSDFTLVDLPNGTAREPRELPEDNVYPEYLLNAWKKAGGVPERLAALASAERAWRDGADEAAGAGSGGAGHDAVAAAAAAAPPARSLARAFAGRPAETRLVEQLRQLIVTVEQKTRGQPAAKAGEMRAPEIAAFLKVRSRSRPATPWRGRRWRWPCRRPAGGRAAARRRGPGAGGGAGSGRDAGAARAGRAGSAAPLLAQALEAVRAVEVVASRPRVHGFVRGELSQSAQLTHESMVLLTSPGYARRRAGRRRAEAGRRLARTAQARQATAAEALAVVDEARAWLPQIARGPSGVAGGRPPTHAAGGRPDASAGSLDDLGRRAARLREKLEALNSRTRPPAGRKLVRAGPPRQRPRPASGASWTGCSRPRWSREPERVDVWKAAVDLARRLEGEVIRLDARDGTKLEEVTPAGRDSLPAALAQARREVALLALQGLPVGGAATAGEGAAGDARAEGLARLRGGRCDGPAKTVALRRRMTCRLWAFLADRYRYLARESAALGREPATTFYRRAAEEYRPWLTAVREDYVELSKANDPPRLLPDRPITQQVEVRAVAGAENRPAGAGAGRDARRRPVAEGDAGWMTLPPSGERGTVVPLQIALTPSAGRGKVPMPKGIVVQAKLGERSFHRKIDISPGGAGAGDPPGRDRPAETARPARRPTPRRHRPRVDETVPAQPDRQGVEQARRQAPRRQRRAHLGRDEARRRRDEGGRVPAAAVTAVAPARDARRARRRGSRRPPPLPTLDGPIHISVISQEDRDEEVAKRTINVEIARPEEYVQLTEVRFDPGAKDRVETKLRLRAADRRAAGDGVAALRPDHRRRRDRRRGDADGQAAGDARRGDAVRRQDVKPPDGDERGAVRRQRRWLGAGVSVPPRRSARAARAGTPRQIETAAVRLKRRALRPGRADVRGAAGGGQRPGRRLRWWSSSGGWTAAAFVAGGDGAASAARERRVGFNPSGPAGAWSSRRRGATGRSRWTRAASAARVSCGLWLVDASNKPLALRGEER